MRPLLPVLVVASGCAAEPCPQTGGDEVAWEAVADGACAAPITLDDVLGPDDGLTDPRDLGFDGDDRLWVANREDDATFIVTDPGTPAQEVERRVDGLAEHFMEEVSAMAFDDDSQFGTCGETRNTYNDTAAPNNFMGPALWTTDLEVFAVENPIGLGSHLDMQHQSPLCVGMAWETGNVYWVFDGDDGRIVRYDFVKDHGPGFDDHADGKVRRLREPEVKRVRNAPGHLVLEPVSGLLYVADTGNDRVLWIDTRSGRRGEDIRDRNEPLADYAWWEDMSWGVLAEGFDRPGGLALHGDRLVVGEWGTGVLHELDLEGGVQRRFDLGVGPEALYGIEPGPDGELWIATTDGARIVHLASE